MDRILKSGSNQILRNSGNRLLASNSRQPYEFTFFGSTEYGRVPFREGIEPVNISVVFWVRFTTTSNTVILENGSNNTSYSFQTGRDTFPMATMKAGHLFFFPGFLAGGSQEEARGFTGTSRPVNDGKPHHIAVTYDKATETIRLYLDGVLDRTVVKTAELTYPLLQKRHWDLGSRGGVASFGGALSEVALFNRVITADEVLANMRNGVRGTETGLIAAYRGRISNGTTLKDTLNTHHGQLHNYGTRSPYLNSRAAAGQRSGLRLNGVDTKVSIPAQTLTDFTFSCWFRKDASKAAGFLSNAGANVLGLSATNTLTFNALSVSIGYSIHSTWNYLHVTREAGVVKASLNRQAFVTIGTDTASVTVNEIGNVFDGIISAPTLYSVANASLAKAHTYLSGTETGLIAQWKLNEGVGAIAYGTKGGNGTITGAVAWTQPSLMNHIAKHLNSNSEAGYAVTPLIEVGSKYTFECWFRNLETAGDNAYFSLSNVDARIYDNPTAFEVRIGGVTASIAKATYGYKTDWRHYAIVKDGATGYCYVNGLLVATLTGIANTQTAAEVTLLADTGGLLRTNGSVDEVRLWRDTARTQAEVQENMNRTMERHTGLVLNLGFESDYHDSSGLGNHAMPTGTPVLAVTDNGKLLLNAPIND